MYEIVYTDVDPDIGTESDPVIIAFCPTDKMAKWVLHTLMEDWYSVNGPQYPNRNFYIREMKFEFLKIRG